MIYKMKKRETEQGVGEQGVGEQGCGSMGLIGWAGREGWRRILQIIMGRANIFIDYIDISRIYTKCLNRYIFYDINLELNYTVLNLFNTIQYTYIPEYQIN